MKKAVKGKVINIEDTEVFESAERALLRNRGCSNLTDDYDMVTNTDKLGEAYGYVDLYNSIYESLPYPLYALDTPIKYATIGAIMFNVSEDIRAFEKENSLIVVFGGESDAIQFVNKHYRFIKLNVDDAENGFIKDIYDYEGMKYYNYFEFMYSALTSSDTIRQDNAYIDFYREWFGDILKVCDKEEDIASELSRILKVREVPAKVNIKTNCIKDMDTGEEYIIDFISKGVEHTELEDTVACINLMTGGYKQIHETDDTELWEMKVYCKKNKNEPMEICSQPRVGINILFMFLCSLKEGSDSKEFSDFKAVIVDGLLVVEVNNEIYYTFINRLREMCPITDMASIYSVDKNNIYIQTTDNSDTTVKTKTTYVFNTKKRQLEMCCIKYTV